MSNQCLTLTHVLRLRYAYASALVTLMSVFSSSVHLLDHAHSPAAAWNSSRCVHWLKQVAAKLAEVFQHSSSNVEGRNGYRSFRNHELRGLDHLRKRACLTAVHNFLLIPNPINSCASGTGILAHCHLPWSVMHKYSRDLVSLALTGRPLRNGFSGSNPARCFLRSWTPSRYPLLPSVHRDEP